MSVVAALILATGNLHVMIATGSYAQNSGLRLVQFDSDLLTKSKDMEYLGVHNSTQAGRAGTNRSVAVLNGKARRFIAMQMSEGCSGSTFANNALRNLLLLHGYFVWHPLKEFLQNEERFKQNIMKNEKGVKSTDTFCTEAQGFEHTWPSDPVRRLEAAWSVLNGTLSCTESNIQEMMRADNVVLLFDGHSHGRMAQVVPFLAGLGARHARIFGFQRKNVMDRLLCHVRDCRYSSSFAVDSNGTQIDCTPEEHESMAVDQLPKVYLDPDEFTQALQLEGRAAWEKPDLRTALTDAGLTGFEVFTNEKLSQYEFTNDTADLEASAESFLQLLDALGVKAQRTTILEYLSTSQGTRDPPLPPEDQIYNYRELQMTGHIVTSNWTAAVSGQPSPPRAEGS